MQARLMHRLGGVLMVATAVLVLAGCGDDGSSSSAVTIDAAPVADANPACQGLDSYGGGATCDLCDAIGSGCDSIDNQGQESHVCDCTQPCPCGLHCGDVELAPGIVVGDVCIR